MSWIHKQGITPYVGRSDERVEVVRTVGRAIDSAVISGACS